VNLRRIRHFVALAETLNFRRAAERLHMAQPPLSVSIQKLEAELGVQLFDRESGGVRLTPTGRTVLAEARKLLFHGDQLREVARQAGEGTGGSLRIGFVGTATFGPLQRLLPAFRAGYPGVELVLQEATTADILQRVEDRSLDVGLVRTPLPQATRLHLTELGRESLIVALPRGHALAGQGPLALADLGRERFVMYAPDHAAGLHAVCLRVCQQAGFVPQVAQQAVQVQTVLALVESGLGIALVPALARSRSSGGIDFRPLVDGTAEAAIGLALVTPGATALPAAGHLRDVAVGLSLV